MKHSLFPLKSPQPDADYFCAVLLERKEPTRVPFIELFLDAPVMRQVVEEVLERKWVDPWPDREALARYLDNYIEAYYRLGYDCIRFAGGLNFPSQRRTSDTTSRSWVEDRRGVISSWEDFEKYPWPDPQKVDLWAYEYIATHLPEGMGLMVCPSSGVFEIVKNCLMGMETLSYLLYDDPDLVSAVFQRVGETLLGFYRNIVGLPNLRGFFQGDDWGFKTATLISPDALRRFVLPWHREFAKVAHDNGLFYFLHSCGYIESVMDDLIEEVGIDGRHSFEDAIIPVTEAKRLYGDKIAILGGVDMDKLSRLPPKELRKYVRRILDECVPGGGYALGSGNSVADYVPLENYLAMLEEGLLWGR